MSKKRANSTNHTKPTAEDRELINQMSKETKEKEDSKIHIKKLEIVFKTEAQEKLWNLIDSKEITICAGSAGTGKTHICILKALELMTRFPTKYKKIIITTPAVTADEDYGYLPGDVDAKISPFIYSIKYVFYKIIGKEKTERMFERGQIEAIAMGFLRGANIDNSILICDEFQNTSPRGAKTLLTRIGENSKFILNGDYSQSDKYKDYKQSGLFFTIDKLKNIPEIGIFEFADSDNVRNPLINIILKKFNGDT